MPWNDAPPSAEEMKKIPSWADQPPQSHELQRLGMSGGEDNSPSTLEAIGRGAGQGATLGFQDEGSGALESGMGAIDALLRGRNNFGDDSRLAGFANLLENYRRARDTQRAQNDAAQEAHPFAYGASELAGSIPTTIAASNPTAVANLFGFGAPALAGAAAASGTEGASLGQKALSGAKAAAKSGALYGGTLGLGKSRADLTDPTLENYGEAAKDVGLGTAIGGLTGGLTGGASPYAGAGVDWLGNKLGSKAEESAVAALGPTAPQLRKVQEAGKVNQLGRQLLDDGVVTPFTSRKGIAAKLADESNTYGKRIGDIVQAVDDYYGPNGVVPAETLVQKARNDVLAPMLKDPFMRADAAKIADAIDAFEEQFKGRNLSIAEMQDFKNTIKNQTGIYERSGEKAIEDGYRGLYRIFNKTAENEIKRAEPLLERGNIEGFIPAKKGYGNVETASKMINGKVSRDSANRFLSPTDYWSGGVGATIGTVIGGPVGTVVGGVTGTAVNHGLRQYGNQIAAGGYNFASNALKSNPQVLGNYLKPLAAAASKSEAALAATDYVLSSLYPDYRAMKDNAAENNGQ